MNESTTYAALPSPMDQAVAGGQDKWRCFEDVGGRTSYYPKSGDAPYVLISKCVKEM